MNEDQHLALLIMMGMAIMGSFSRQLTRGEVTMQHGQVLSTIGRLLGKLVVSTFSGILVYFITRNTSLAQEWAYALAGVSGWAGPEFIDAIWDLVSRKVGLPEKFDEPKTDDQHTKTDDKH
jgi:hypothetical protein